jgi:putative ABC transport system permease protein
MRTFGNAKLTNKEYEKLNAITLGAVNFSEITQMIPGRLVPKEGSIPGSGENDTVVLGYETCFLNETEQLVHVGDNVTLQMQIGNPPLSLTVNKTLQVSAILTKSGGSAITNFDYWAFVPLDSITYPGQTRDYNIILARVSDPENSEQVAASIKNVFENPYSISLVVPLSYMRQVDRILNFVQIFLMAIASISLLVAGIGIMNIMTVSVMERTREIGILKAIGAKSRTVLSMFLSEAILIGMMGSLIGLVSGYALSYILVIVLSSFLLPGQQSGIVQNPGTAQKLTITPVFSLEWTIIALIFGIVICVIFGLYPARKASKLNPVDALRYE